MPFENEDQAIEALTAANAQDAAGNQPEPAVTDDSAQAVETPAVPDQPRIDPATLNLPPEAQAYLEQREREMQGDYTRKTQEVAAQRREAEQAMEFIDALNSDPNFALQVHQNLSQALQAQGYSVAEADAAASQQVGNQPWDEYDDTFADPYAEKIQQLEAWQAEQEQRFALAEATQQVESGVAAIRAANPNYTDDDVSSILTMAFAYNGDVSQAEQAYKSVTQRVTENYLAQKASVPASLNQPVSAGHAEVPPEGFTSLNDPRLEEAAKRMLAEGGGQW